MTPADSAFLNKAKEAAGVGSLLGSSMQGIPSITGGAAGQSGAAGGDIKNTIFSIAGGGAGLWVFLGFIAFLVWKKKNK